MKKIRLFQLLPAVAALLLATSCSNESDVTTTEVPNEPQGKVIHYVATVTDGNATRATLGTSGDVAGKYIFETGDKLYVTGSNISGVMTIHAEDVGKRSDATFEGDLTYTGSGTPAADLALNAVLVSTSDLLHTTSETAITATAYPTTAIADTRAKAIQKYSQFTATSTYGAKSFSLAQQSSFLDFTVTFEDGTTTNTDLDISISNGGSVVRTGSVTTATADDKVVAKFVVAFPAGTAGTTTMNNASVTLGTKDAISFGGTTTLAANKFYKISKTVSVPGLLSGQFSVSSTKKVYFSKGNLQATWDGSLWTWSFAENQYDYIGNAAGNTSINGNGTVSANNVTVDLFGWVGQTSNWTGAAQYGISNSGSEALNKADGYGRTPTEALKSDWGKTIDDKWRTLTRYEWTWLIGPSSPFPGTNCRTSSTVNGKANARFAKATVVGKSGIIIFPDTYTHPNDVTQPTEINNGNANFTVNNYDATAWGKMETAGCVFLPAAGYRIGAYVDEAGSYGRYWSSTSYPSNANYAYYFNFTNINLIDENYLQRYLGYSVRLVRDVE